MKVAVAHHRVSDFQPVPLRALLEDLSGLGLLVVDGYADLDPGGRPGLGAHAHAEFGIPVIGVAKSRFRTATHAVPVLRGSSVAIGGGGPEELTSQFHFSQRWHVSARFLLTPYQ